MTPDSNYSCRAHRRFGNGCSGTTCPPHDGSVIVAPFRPHRWQRALWRSMSDEACGPQRIRKAASATGRQWPQRSPAQ